jgi:hypothetical protein
MAKREKIIVLGRAIECLVHRFAKNRSVEIQLQETFSDTKLLKRRSLSKFKNNKSIQWTGAACFKTEPIRQKQVFPDCFGESSLYKSDCSQ